MVDLEHTVDFDLRVEVDLLLEDLPRSELLCDPRVDFDLCVEVIFSSIDMCLYSLVCDLTLDFDLFVELDLLLEVLGFYHDLCLAEPFRNQTILDLDHV